MECGTAIADVLCGDVNPSGKLVDTIVYDYADYPSANCFNYNKRETKYEEGIFVGYRYFETFAKDKVMYPFGFGLSYTEFEYSDYTFSVEKDTITVSVNVTNVGDLSGREVVQVYCAAPQGKLEKPAIELKGYAKTKELEKGETENVKVCFYDVSEGKADLCQFINQMNVEELISLSLGQPLAFPEGTSGVGNLKKYGVPNPQTADGPVGIRRSVNTTCFPCATLIACSWDSELQYAMGAAMGYEGYSTGIDVLLGPAMNIHRNPLGGRCFEYFSEDPLITGKAAAALVNGMQSQGLCATIKHFAANNCEDFRNINNSIVEERALREIYLKGFEIAVKESNPAYIMTSYNLLNGEHISANAQLLRGVLRDEWKYEGATMTDWRNGVPLTSEIIAGNNIKMPFGYPDEGEKVLQAYKNGQISLSILRENAYYCNPRGRKKIVFGIGHCIFDKFPKTHFNGDILGEPAGREFCSLNSGAWVEEEKFVIRCNIIDDYVGNLTITIGFKEDNVALSMYKNAQFFLKEYDGYASGVRKEPKNYVE